MKLIHCFFALTLLLMSANAFAQSRYPSAARQSYYSYNRPYYHNIQRPPYPPAPGNCYRRAANGLITPCIDPSPPTPVYYQTPRPCNIAERNAGNIYGPCYVPTPSPPRPCAVPYRNAGYAGIYSEPCYYPPTPTPRPTQQACVIPYGVSAAEARFYCSRGYPVQPDPGYIDPAYNPYLDCQLDSSAELVVQVNLINGSMQDLLLERQAALAGVNPTNIDIDTDNRPSEFPTQAILACRGNDACKQAVFRQYYAADDDNISAADAGNSPDEFPSDKITACRGNDACKQAVLAEYFNDNDTNTAAVPAATTAPAIPAERIVACGGNAACTQQAFDAYNRNTTASTSDLYRDYVYTRRLAASNSLQARREASMARRLYNTSRGLVSRPSYYERCSQFY